MIVLLEVVLEFRTGLMALNTLVIGLATKQMVKVSFTMQQEIYMTEHGRTIRRGGRVCMYIKMEVGMKVLGKTICSTAMAKKFGQMNLVTKDITKVGLSMAREKFNSAMDPLMKGIFLRII